MAGTTELTELQHIINALRKTAATDTEAAQRLEAAEEVQREIDEIHRAAAIAASQGRNARLAHCQELAQLLDAVTKRLAEDALNPDPSEVQYTDLMLLLESTDEIPYEVARLQAIAKAIATVAHTGLPGIPT